MHIYKHCLLEIHNFIYVFPLFQILADDPTFATVHHGHFIPYATAGDCFSVVPCPQGRFHVSLNGTGLVVAPDVDWSTEGHSVSRQISRDAVSYLIGLVVRYFFNVFLNFVVGGSDGSFDFETDM